MKAKKRISKHRSVYRNKVVYPFLKKVYHILKERPEIVELKKIKTVQGWYGRGGKELIEVDYRKQFLPTLLHEILHHIHEDWSETKVLKEESKITNAMSIRQVENVFIAYGEALKRVRKDL